MHVVFREQASDIIYQYEQSRWSFSISSKLDNYFGRAKFTVQISTSLRSLLLAVRTSTATTASKNGNSDHFHPQFLIIVFKIKRSSFSVV